MSGKDRIIVGKMIKYCEDSIKHIGSLSFEEFSSNELVLTFSIFSLSQLGELAAKLSEEVKLNHSEIPWNALKSIRNRIVHDYDFSGLSAASNVYTPLQDLEPVLIA